MRKINWVTILKRDKLPWSFTHCAVIDGVTICKSKTRVRVDLADVTMMATPKRNQTLDEAAKILARRSGLVGGLMGAGTE